MAQPVKQCISDQQIAHGIPAVEGWPTNKHYDHTDPGFAQTPTDELQMTYVTTWSQTSRHLANMKCALLISKAQQARTSHRYFWKDSSAHAMNAWKRLTQ